MKLLLRIFQALAVIVCLLYGTACSSPPEQTVLPASCPTQLPVILPSLQTLPPVTCPATREAKNSEFNQVGPAVGETAIDFSLESTTGERITLSTLLAEKPVVLIFGSFT
jgi:cytochrome oxidase Cu insertion factor (SCO1/SenC/PrrC family)